MFFQHLTTAAVCGLAIGTTASTLLSHDVKNLGTLQHREHEVPASHNLHERQLPHWSKAWQKRSRIARSTVLPMRIGLKQRNLDLGHKKLLDISDPKSDSYGQHMSSEEVAEMFAPAQERVDAVKEWLAAAGITAERVSISLNKQWLQFDAKVQEAEDLLFAEYHTYEHLQTGSQGIATDDYHVPAAVQEHIDYISPGIKLRVSPSKINELKRRSMVKRMEARGISTMNTGAVPIPQAGLPVLPQLNNSVCYKYVTNQCIRNQYRIPESNTSVPGNELGIYESLNDHYSKADLDAFFWNLYPRIPNGTYPIEKLIDGAVGAAEDGGAVGIESNLDFQSAWPLIWPQKTVLFQEDDQYIEINQTDLLTPYLGFWNTFFDALDGSYCTYSAFGETGDCKTKECLDPTYPDPNPGGYQGATMCGTYKPTNVLSISYGGGEADVPAYYTRRQCSEIMKLGLQGITVVMSSGDAGVGSYPGDAGLTTGCAGPSGRVFYPDNDATCPYVLAVGGTEFRNATGPGSACKLIEVATSRFPSGGGFSNVFDAPEWQTDAIKTYFDTVKLNFTGYTEAGTNFSDVGDGVYKIGGRGYPDVAAVADHFVIHSGGAWGTIGGTSLSAPIWSAMLTLVNEARLTAGKKPVGFVNPVLYAHPEIFQDITEGSNPNCKSTGFLAAKGWDPVTGLGSPKYPKLLAVLLALP